MTTQMSIKKTKEILNVKNVKRAEPKLICERCTKRKGQFYLSGMCEQCWRESRVLGDQN